MKARLIVPPGGYIPLCWFSEFTDPSKITYYSLKKEGKSLILKFYDKNKKLIKLRREKNGQ